MLYSLCLDERTSPEESRDTARKRFDEALARPLDKQAAEEYDRDRWGLSEEAIAASEETEILFPETE